MCSDIGVQVIAEGIETAGERDFLRDAGIRLMQGYLFARPEFQGIAKVDPGAWEPGSTEPLNSPESTSG